MTDKRSLRRAAVYFGLREVDDADLRSTGLVLLGDSLAARGVLGVWLTTLSAIAILVIFDRDPASLAAGTALGALVWCGVPYFVDVRSQLPTDPVPTASADAPWEAPTRRLRDWSRSVADVALCLGLVWFADALHIGSTVVPGLFAGNAIAGLLGASQVWRWEKRHRARLAFRLERSEYQVFAVLVTATPSRRDRSSAIRAFGRSR